MNRNLNSKNVAYFYPLFLIYSFYLLPPTSWAQGRFSTDPVSPNYFYWLIIIMMTFVQGALNGLTSLALRNFRHEYAGTRWTQAFWAGFPCAFTTTHLLIFFIDYVHANESVTQLSPLYISIWLALFLCLNFFLVFRLSIWAAQEN